MDPDVSMDAGPEEIKLLVYKFINQMPAWKPFFKLDACMEDGS